MSSRAYRSISLLKHNIQNYLDRELINNGLYLNVKKDQNDVYGNNLSLLKRVNGNLYESFVDRWIYETDASGIFPYNTVIASGIYVNNTFHAKGSGPHNPVINYNKGQVILNGTAIPLSSSVKAVYSYKHVIVDFPESNVVNNIFSQARDNIDFTKNTYPSGNMRQLPLVVIDVQNADFRPMQVGGGRIASYRIVFHVLASNNKDLDNICDLLTDEKFRKVIKGVDFNKTPQLFTYQGDIAATYKNYTVLQDDPIYTWTKIYIDQASLISKDVYYNARKARIDWRVTCFLTG